MRRVVARVDRDVVRAQARLDARRGIEMFSKVEVPILGIIQNMATYVCSQCGHAEPIFGLDGGATLAEDYGVPLLASLPLSRQMRECADSGQPISVVMPTSVEARAYAEAVDALILALDGGSASRVPTITMGD